MNNYRDGNKKGADKVTIVERTAKVKSVCKLDMKINRYREILVK